MRASSSLAAFPIAIMVDTLGLLLTVVVTVASVQDRDGARLLFRHLPGSCKKLKKIWLDGGYSGCIVDWVDWFNHRRLLEPIGNILPAELEKAYYRQLEKSARIA